MSIESEVERIKEEEKQKEEERKRREEEARKKREEDEERKKREEQAKSEEYAAFRRLFAELLSSAITEEERTKYRLVVGEPERRNLEVLFFKLSVCRRAGSDFHSLTLAPIQQRAPGGRLRQVCGVFGYLRHPATAPEFALAKLSEDLYVGNSIDLVGEPFPESEFAQRVQALVAATLISFNDEDAKAAASPQGEATSAAALSRVSGCVLAVVLVMVAAAISATLMAKSGMF